MSLLNEIAKIYLKNGQRKDKLNELSFAEKQSGNVPEPPAKIVKRGKFEKVEIEDVKAFWFNKSKQNRGVLVFLHGGSYISGPYKVHWEYFTDMCLRMKMAGILIDYKLAPQNPFPNGLNDVITVLNTLNLQNYFLLGDSAGGGLTLAVCYKLNELGKILPKKIILMSGWFDVTGDNLAIQLNVDSDPMLLFKNLKICGEWYAGEESPKNPLISPIYGDVSILPPTLIQIGTNDLLLWDNRKFYLKCLEAGIEIQYEEYENTFHDFMLVGYLKEAKKARKSQVEFFLK